MFAELSSYFNPQSASALTEFGLWGYLLLGLLVAIEGPIVTVLAGILAASGRFNPLLAFLAAGIGNFSADAAWYFLGRWGNFDAWVRRFPRLGKFWPQIEQLRVGMQEHAAKFVLMTKLSLGVAIIPTLIAAGMSRVSWRRLLPISIGSEIVWSGSLILLGYFFGQYLPQIEAGLQWLMLIGFFLLGGLLFWGWRQIMLARLQLPESHHRKL